MTVVKPIITTSYYYFFTLFQSRLRIALYVEESLFRHDDAIPLLSKSGLQARPCVSKLYYNNRISFVEPHSTAVPLSAFKLGTIMHPVCLCLTTNESVKTILSQPLSRSAPRSLMNQSFRFSWKEVFPFAI